MNPRFSIVIPTIGRPELLTGAIRSALDQTHPDFELIVSNNGENRDTDRAVSSFDDPRIRLVRTPTRLMHDHWTFALGHARGAYALMLCDDDALHPRALEVVASTLARHDADLLCWRSLWHFAPDWFEPAARGTCGLGPPITDRCFRIDGENLIECAFEGRVMHSLFIPRMMNAVVRTELLARATAAGSPPFRPICPDYASMLAFAGAADHMLFLDAPLYAAGATAVSIGASCLRHEEAGRRFVNDLLERESALRPLPAMLTTSALIAQTFHQCAREFPALDGRTLDRAHVYGIVRRELDELAATGRDVGPEVERFESALRSDLADVAPAIRRFIEHRVHVGSERFLAGPVDDEPVLGCGPRSMPKVRLEVSTPGDAARSIDGVIDRFARDVSHLAEDVRARSGDRTPVLLGAGGNGRGVLRVLAATARSRVAGWIVLDERIDEGVLDAPVRRDLDGLRPRRHFVLVTPDAAAGLERRLAALGFRPGRDFEHLGRMARSAMPTAGAASTSP